MSSFDTINIGPYRMVRLISVGQSTEIWEVMHDSARQRYALKKLRPEASDKENLALIRKEYDVGHGLKHPRLIEVLEFGRHKGQPYVLLELFSAPNLKLLLQQHGFERLAPLAAKFVEQSSEALAYFNGQGWVHRDIKPDNFLMNETGEVKLIDFALGQKPKAGLAKFFGGKTKVIQGTPSYMSPEQIRGEPLDFKADIYSYGCTLYELFTGKRPFTGVTTNDLLNRHIRAAAPPIEIHNRSVTPEFSALVRGAMAKKPEDRPDIELFRRELRVISVFKKAPKETVSENTEES